MKKRVEETQRFRTRACDGAEYYVVQVTTRCRIDDEPPSPWMTVEQAYRTAHGQPVRLCEDGAFMVLGTGARLVRA